MESAGPKQMVDLARLKVLINDAEDEIHDEDLTGILREIYSLVERVQRKIADCTDDHLRARLHSFERDETYSHDVLVEGRRIVFKMRNYVTACWGAITRLDDQQELQIRLGARRPFFVERWKRGILEPNVLPAYKSEVRDLREPLTRNSGETIGSDVSFGGPLGRKYGHLGDLDYLSAAGKSPLELIAEFRDSLRKAVEQLGA